MLEQAFKLAASRWGLHWLLGPVGTILSFPLAILIGWLSMEGFLTIEFSRIDLQVGQERIAYVRAIDKLKGAGKLSLEERNQIIEEVKTATKEFISIRQYLRQ